jgi:ferric enterobactin receptor
MKKPYWLLLFLTVIFPFSILKAQNPNTSRTKLVLNGEVLDEDNKPVVGASVSVEDGLKKTATDSNGYFRLDLARGIYTLKVKSVGFYDYSQKVDLSDNVLLKIRLTQKVNELEGIEITDQAKDKNVSSTQQGTSVMTISTIKKLPTLLGEVDVIRSLQTLAGVTTVGEGSNGFNVRGGNIDQNLVLMDDIPIFNSSHLLGFYSVFNPDAVKDITLFRGGTPSKYGGRASSVLDIRLKEPNLDSAQITGGVGILASRFMVETPLVKEKLGILVGGRSSYTDLLFPLLGEPSISNTKANFYDITAKLRWKINEKNQFYLTGYYSDDNFKITGDSLAGIEVNASSTLFKWQTRAFSGRWNHIFSDKFSMNTLVSLSDYAPKMSITDTAYASDFDTRIRHSEAKFDFKYFTNPKHTFNFGVSGILYNLNPGDLVPTNALSNILPVNLPSEKGLEIAAYLMDDWTPNKRISLTYGLRFANFMQLGGGRVYDYNPAFPREEFTRTGTTLYEPNQVMQSYSGIEPRLSLKIGVGTEGSIKLGYQRMQQFVHLISNTTSALPTARWKLSDRYIKPQISDQVSLGFFQNFNNNTVEASLEFYYKKTDNFPDYRSGTNILLLDGVETAVLQGIGQSYGAEFYIKKKVGRTTGWLTYTYARSLVKVNSPYPEDKPFTGQYYPTNFDKPHVLNLIVNYQMSRTVSLTTNFTYGSGRPATYADDKYYFDNVYIPNYTNRNLDRIPDYHRVDLSINIEPKKNQAKRFSSSWNISFYNVYARRNAYSVFFRTKNDSVFQFFNKALSYRLAVIGTIVPSVTWNFKW